MNPFDYCAMFYADTWLERDHRFCERLPNPAAHSRLQLLAEALRFYRVARCWRKLHKDDDETRFQPLLDIMDNIAATAVRPLNRTELVEAVIIQLEPSIGCEPFSLTTKT